MSVKVGNNEETVLKDAVKVIKDETKIVKDDISNWWNKLSKEVRDVVLVSVGVLAGVAMVRIANSISEEDDYVDVPVSEEMKQQMNSASKMAKNAKKLAAKAIKNADKAINTVNGK